jgi:hypothetical protein
MRPISSQPLTTRRPGAGRGAAQGEPFVEDPVDDLLHAELGGPVRLHGEQVVKAGELLLERFLQVGAGRLGGRCHELGHAARA